MLMYPVIAFRIPVLLLFFSTYFTLSSIAQEAILKGKITDVSSGNQPLIGAIVIDVDDRTRGAVADKEGIFELKLLAGKKTLVASFLGMRSDTLILHVEAGKNYQHHFRMQPVQWEMGPVVVSASKYEQSVSEVTVSMQILQPKLIESKNTVNIKSALEQAPGLTILDEEPQIRGGSGFSFGVGSRVASLIDGLPIMTGDAGRTDWAFIPTENIEQVEIVQGASSVLYGSSALSGTINFRTRFPKERNSTYIRTYAGMYSSPRREEAKWWDGNAYISGINFSHGMRRQQHDLVIGGAFNYDHNYIGPYILDGSLPIKADTLDNSDVANRSGRINFNYRYRSAKVDGLSAGLNGNIMTGHTNFSLVWGNDSSGIYRAFPGTMTITDFTAFYLDPYVSYMTQNGFRHSLRGRWYQTDNKNSNDQSNFANIYLANYEFSKSFHRLSGINLTGGLYYSDIHSEAPLYSSGGSPNNKLRNRAGYLQLSQKFFKLLNVVAGMRAEYFRMNSGEEVVEPVFRAGMNMEIGKATYLRTSYGQGYRYPTIAERYIVTSTGGIYVFPNPQIQPESSWNAEAGIKQGFKVGSLMGFLDLAAFQQEYHNTIEYIYAIWAPDSAGFKFVNTGDSRVKGLEASVMGGGNIFRNLELKMLLGYTYIKPQTLNPNQVFAIDSAEASGGVATELAYSNTSTDTSDHILKYRFRHLVKADIELTYRSISVGGSARYYSFMENIDKTFYDLDNTVLPTGIIEYREENNSGTLVFDARVSYTYKKKYSIAIIANNLTNLEYSLRPLKIEAPRTVFLQLTASL